MRIPTLALETEELIYQRGDKQKLRHCENRRENSMRRGRGILDRQGRRPPGDRVLGRIITIFDMDHRRLMDNKQQR